MTERSAPVSLNEREKFMDALRGFAILGIFIANLVGLTLYNPTDTTKGWHFPELDKQMLFLQHLFIEGKFYSIFSLLFGWGLALQIKRTQGLAGNNSVGPIIIRRLFFMLLIGLIHVALIWNGDIIAFYALTGCVLLLFIRIEGRKLFILGVVSLFIPILLYWLKMQYPVFNKPSDFFHSVCQNLDKELLGITKQEEFKGLLRRGSLLELLIYNFNGAFYRLGDLILQSRFFKVLGMFLIGYSLVGRHYYKVLLNDPRLLITIFFAGLIVGLPANYIMAGFMETPANYTQFKAQGLYQTIAYSFGVAPLALAYVSLLGLLYNNHVGQRILTLLIPVGKMALTNYISHSLICIVLFYGIGFGLMGTLGPTAWTMFAIIVFGFQIIFSTIWLQYFQFGPLEWMWRSLTYGTLQPFRRNALLTERSQQ